MPWSDRYEPEELAMEKAPIERKVKTSTWTALAASLALAVINAVQEQPGVLEPLPPWTQFLVIAVLPPLATFLGGYAAPHTARPW